MTTEAELVVPVELTVVLPSSGPRHVVLRVVTEDATAVGVPVSAPAAEDDAAPALEIRHRPCVTCGGVLESDDQADLCSIKRLPPLCAACYRSRLAPEGRKALTVEED